MSRVGKNPVLIPENVKVNQEGLVIKIEGPKGSLERKFLPNASIAIDDNQVLVTRRDNSKFSRSYHGTVRQLINNMVEGVTKGFAKTLKLVGIGYKASLKGNNLQLALGYSHPIDVPAEEGVSFKVEGDRIFIEGIDKEKVGRIAATIRSKRKPDVYKGKGVLYDGEIIKLKKGKKS